MWSRNLALTAMAVFFMRFGEGLLGGARMNFFVDTIGIDGGQVLLLEGIREVPGLLLVFIAALTMHLPLSWRAAASAAILGLGFMAHALVNSYTALLAVAVAASFGLHGYQPLHPALGMALATERTRGRVLGVLASVGSLAGIAGMGALALTSNVLRDISLRWFYVIGGGFIIVSVVFFLRLSKDLGTTHQKQPRLVFRRRYWLYYALTFFEGTRKEVLGSFCTLMLVERFGWKVWQLSPLLLTSAVLGLFLAPYLGGLVDRFGPRYALAGSYAVLALSALGYAFIPNAAILAGLYVVIRLAGIMHLGVSVYAHQIAPTEEVTPTLSAGVSINHISSVAMPLLFGVLIPIIGYTGVYLGSAVIITISVFFALMIRTLPHQEGAPEPALAV